MLSYDDVQQGLMDLHECGKSVHNQLCIGVWKRTGGDSVDSDDALRDFLDDRGESGGDDNTLLGCIEDVDLLSGNSELVGHVRDGVQSLDYLPRGGGERSI
ncbi:hypothetical protein Mapa_005731 [Marchantia paleacea]|nr:hypothetical protein Mapa_005731 [Marchantia paleacea]